MTDWVLCPNCGLRHSAREDGRCPKCMTAVAAAPPAGNIAAALGREPPQPANAVTAGSRIAGAILLANAACVLVEVALSAGKPAGGFNPLGSIIVDVIAGGALLAGKPKAKHIGLFRIGLGAVIFGGLMAAKGEFFLMGLQLVFSASLALLIVGAPARARIAVASVMAGFVFLFEAAGLVALGTGSNPLAAALMRMKGEASPIAGTVQGTKLDYCFEVPPGWYLRAPEAAHRNQAASDLWLVKPELDAHVIVLAESLDRTVSQERLEEVVVGQMQKSLQDFKLLGKSPLPGGNVLRARGRAKELDLEYLRGVFAWQNRALQLVAFARPEAFARVEPDLQGMMRSFRPSCALAR